MNLSDTDSVGSDSSLSTSDDSLHFMGGCDSKLQQARINLPSLALICERFQLSDCAGAAMANAVIKNLNSSNLLTKYDDSLAIDRSKLGQERVKYCEEMRKNDDQQFFCMNGMYNIRMPENMQPKL